MSVLFESPLRVAPDEKGPSHGMYSLEIRYSKKKIQTVKVNYIHTLIEEIIYFFFNECGQGLCWIRT